MVFSKTIIWKGVVMVRAIDVAQYILKKKKRMSAMKLQKLVYYCQAWSLVWDDEPLFKDQIQAWINGPVIPNLYRKHKGRFKLTSTNGIEDADPSKLNNVERETVDAVLNHYGDKSSQWLSDLTHLERPWKEAREGLPLNERGHRVITLGSMAEYYSGL